MEDRLREATRQYLDAEDALKELERQKEVLQAQQMVFLRSIHMTMREMDIDEINVRNMRFSRVVKLPGKRQRRQPLKDAHLVNVLKKHLSGEDNKLRTVLEDIAQIRNPPDLAPPVPPEPQEVLVRRNLKKTSS